MPDDSAMFLLWSRHESWNIHQADQRNVECVAEPYKPGRLGRCIAVQNTCQDCGLIGHQTNGLPSHSAKPADDVPGETRMNFQKFRTVQNAVNQDIHVISLIGIWRNQIIKGRIRAFGRISQIEKRGLQTIIGRQKIDQPSNFTKAKNVVWDHKMGDAADCSVNLGASQLFRADILMNYSFDDIRACNKHVGGIFNHKGKIGHGRAVNRAAGARPHDTGNLGNHTAGLNISMENLSISSQRIHAFLNPGATGVVQPNDGRADPDRMVHNLADFLGMGFPQGTSNYGKVLAEDKHLPAINGSMTGYHAISRVTAGSFFGIFSQRAAPSGFQNIELLKRACVQ